MPGSEMRPEQIRRRMVDHEAPADKGGSGVADAEKQKKEEKKQYYRDRLLEDLRIATRFVDKKLPDSQRAFEERKMARARLEENDIDTKKIVKRRQYPTESVDKYKAYAREVRDNIELLELAVGSLRPERIVGDPDGAISAIGFLGYLGADMRILKEVGEERVAEFRERSRREAEEEAKPKIEIPAVDVGTPESAPAKEPEPRPLKEWEKVIEEGGETTDYWVEKVAQYGLVDDDDKRLVDSFVKLEPNNWGLVVALLRKVSEIDPSVVRIVAGLGEKLPQGSDGEPEYDAAKEKYYKRRSAFVKLGLIRAQNYLFKYYSFDEDGNDPIEKAYKSIGTVKTLRATIFDRMAQIRAFKDKRETVNDAAEEVIHDEHRIAGLTINEENKAKLEERYRTWALNKVSRMVKQVEGQWKDDDPRLWDEDTPITSIVTRIRKDILAKETSSSRVGQSWVDESPYFDGSIHFGALDCIVDEILREELAREVDARDILDSLFRGYETKRTNAANLIEFLKSNGNSPELGKVIQVLASGRDGFGESIGRGLAEYIAMGEKSFEKYYREPIEVSTKDGDRDVVYGRFGLRRKIQELTLVDKPDPDKAKPYEAVLGDKAKDDLNFFAVPMSKERKDNVVRVGVRTAIAKERGKTTLLSDLNEVNSEGGELIALRLAYFFGLAGKFGFEQDSTNNERDGLATMFRMDESWQYYKERSVSSPTPFVISGGRYASDKERPLAIVAPLVTWIEHITDLDKKVMEELLEGEWKALAEKKARVVDIRGDRLKGKYPVEGSEDDVVDFLATERLSEVYVALRKGLFHKIPWGRSRSEIGKFSAYAGFALDLKAAMEKPGVEPKDATPTEGGMRYLKDKVSSALIPMKVKVPDEYAEYQINQGKKGNRKDDSERQYEAMVDRVLYRWAFAIMESHDPRVESTPSTQEWRGYQFDEFIDDVVAAKFIKEDALVERLKKHFGHRLQGLPERMRMGYFRSAKRK